MNIKFHVYFILNFILMTTHGIYTCTQKGTFHKYMVYNTTEILRLLLRFI